MNDPTVAFSFQKWGEECGIDSNAIQEATAIIFELFEDAIQESRWYDSVSCTNSFP